MEVLRARVSVFARKWGCGTGLVCDKCAVLVRAEENVPSLGNGVLSQTVLLYQPLAPLASAPPMSRLSQGSSPPLDFSIHVAVTAADVRLNTGRHLPPNASAPPPPMRAKRVFTCNCHVRYLQSPSGRGAEAVAEGPPLCARYSSTFCESFHSNSSRASMLNPPKLLMAP